MDFEDLRLCDLLEKVQNKAEEIAATRNVSQFKELGVKIQAVYDYFVVSGKSYEEQQPMLKNLFSGSQNANSPKDKDKEDKKHQDSKAPHKSRSKKSRC